MRPVRTICVDREDVEKGDRCKAKTCAIALAVQELFPDWHVEVSSAYVVIDRPIRALSCRQVEHERLRAILPPVARWFISQFDRGVKPDPIAFDLIFDKSKFNRWTEAA